MGEFIVYDYGCGGTYIYLIEIKGFQFITIFEGRLKKVSKFPVLK